ncbi:hypothetical protein [Halocatena salina]|uniref:Uncharacterized protein n=1 Tax=Halocatena salina TaxID=2934340 RepID=A0A8U0A9Y8_9EURY|nr:hypothetical protein [Halocatena salina]UPM45268.1 hypothetical protein MW046_19165 [Halocatena salina]
MGLPRPLRQFRRLVVNGNDSLTDTVGHLGRVPIGIDCEVGDAALAEHGVVGSVLRPSGDRDAGIADRRDSGGGDDGVCDPR